MEAIETQEAVEEQEAFDAQEAVEESFDDTVSARVMALDLTLFSVSNAVRKIADDPGLLEKGTYRIANLSSLIGSMRLLATTATEIECGSFDDEATRFADRLRECVERGEDVTLFGVDYTPSFRANAKAEQLADAE